MAKKEQPKVVERQLPGMVCDAEVWLLQGAEGRKAWLRCLRLQVLHRHHAHFHDRVT